MDETLEERLARAAAEGDYELAAQLRDQIARLHPGTKLRRQEPGKMGLGTSEQAMKPPPGWVRPAKPDPLTSNTKRRKDER